MVENRSHEFTKIRKVKDVRMEKTEWDGEGRDRLPNFWRRYYRRFLVKYTVFRIAKNGGLKSFWYVRNKLYQLRVLLSPRGFYRAVLAKFWVFRLLKQALLFALFKLPSTVKNSGNFVRYRLLSRNVYLRMVSASDFLSQQRLKPVLFAEASEMEIPGPQFIGHYPMEFHAEPNVTLELPAITAVELRDVRVMGGTNLIYFEDQAIYPDLFIPRRDSMPIELHGIASVDPGRCTIRVPLAIRSRREASAISLLGQCTGNYAHWLTETLPKLLVADGIEAFDGLPLLVDDWIHPNFHASVKLLNRNERPIIFVRRWSALSLVRLVDVSPTAYVPADFRGSDPRGGGTPEPAADQFPFSKVALDMLRQEAQVIASVQNNHGAKRLYIQRNPESVGNGRFVGNIEEVERLIFARGFKGVDPGKMSVAEQMAIFRDAEVVVSPIGAALANLIFAPPGCTVIVLAPYFENANYYYFSNLMGVLGHRLRYVLGPQLEINEPLLHRNYKIDIAALEEALTVLAGGDGG